METEHRPPVGHLDVRANKGIVVITTDTDDPAIAAARSVAGEMAARSDVPVLLYDRSEETWGDSEHHDGPMRRGDQRLDQRPHLVVQMAALATMGATPLAWVASLPSISGILTAISDLDADVIVVPDALDRNLLERVLEGDSLPTAVAAQVSKNPHVNAVVLSVSPGGVAQVVPD